MTDHLTKKQRSWNMSRIYSKNTKLELLVRQYLFAQGLRYRLHSKNILGKPDISIMKYKIAIFVHGCFWHGHDNCKLFRIPKSNIEYWKQKLFGNKQRDEKVKQILEKAGWLVIIIWECELKYNKELTLSRVNKKIKAKIDSFL